MRELLAHPAVQAGAAPLAAGLAAALLLRPLRLGGLAAAAGFFVYLHLAGRLELHQKMIVVMLAAPALGALTDLAFRPTRSAGAVLGIVFGLAAFWVFLALLGRKPPQELVLYAVGITLLTALTVGVSVLSHGEPARAGALGTALGAAIGLGSYASSWRPDMGGFALAAASAGFLVVSMAAGRGLIPGATLTLASGTIASLLAAAAVLSGRLPWQAAAALVLVPLAVRLPLPARAQTPAALAYAALGAAAVVAIARYA